MERQTQVRSTRTRKVSENRVSKSTAGASDKALSKAEMLLVELRLQNEELRAARDQAELALKRFADLYDSAPVGYLTLRRDGSIRDVNLAGAKLLGASRAKLRNTAFAGFVHGDDEFRFAEFAAKVFDADGKRQCELTLLPEGDRAPVTVHVEAKRDERAQECRLTIVDISERKRAENERRRAEETLQRANSAKSRFLAAASHDLRQPLSALSLYVGALEDMLPPRDRALAENMRYCVAGLTEMLSDLLDLSKLEAGAIIPKGCDFSVDSLLRKVLASFEPKARRKRLALRYRHCGKFGRTDPVLFRRIVSNLLSNAIRYTERGGVLIGCRRRNGKRWLEVWDTGIGIPTDRISDIFEEFTRLDDAGSAEQGAGIGLSIVAKEAALLGLELRVRSRVGKGSVFAVELPPGKPVVMPSPPKRYRRPLRIAVVEDDPDVARALSYSLSARGHMPVVGTSGAEAMELLSGSAPDVVISDYRLSDAERGDDVVAAMRAAFGETLPAIVITADTAPSLVRQLARGGIVVQHKPLDMEGFCGTLAELTDRRSTLR